MDARSRLKSSAVISCALHVLVFSLTAFSFASCTGPVLQGREAQPQIIEATAVHPKEIEQYYERRSLERRQALEREKRAQRKQMEAERSRADALRKKKRESLQLEKARQERRQALLQERERKAEEARRLKEKLRRQEAERKKREAGQRLRAEQKRERERKRKAEEARLKKEREAEQRRKRAAEEAKRLAEEDRQLKMRKRQRALWTRQYVGLLRDSIERQWKKPPSSVKGGDCVLKVRQSPAGEVLDLNIVSCDGDRLFMRSVEEAVWKASPLPPPPSPDVFDADVELTFRQKY